MLKNFVLSEDDKQDSDKINTVAFNKDINGNYLVTIGKKDRQSFGERERMEVDRGGSCTHNIRDSEIPSGCAVVGIAYQQFKLYPLSRTIK